MKRIFASALALAALALLGACSIQMGAKSHGGRVIISAPRNHTHTAIHNGIRMTANHNKAAPAKASIAQYRHPRIAASRAIRARDLSAATDVKSMSYTLIDTDSNTVLDTQPIDPSFPYVDLFLEPNGNYRIIVDVEITGTAPGVKAGVRRYGDQADFTVDPDYDTYVDMLVHPTKALVFDPASLAGTGTTTVVYHDPESSMDPTTWDLFNGTLTASTADKFFYGADAKLYYFNKNANAVYVWNDMGTLAQKKPINPVTDEKLNGVDLGAWASVNAIQIYAVCADPWDPATLWVAGRDDTDWYFLAVDIDGQFVWNGLALAEIYDGGADLTDPVITGIAVDSTWSDVYLTYYTDSNDGNLYSGVLQYFDNGGGFSLFANYPESAPDFLFSDSASSVATDVMWDQGKAWVTASPIKAARGTADANTGRADLWTFNDYLFPLATFPTSRARTYNTGTPPTFNTSTTKLVMPNRFLGPIQGSKVYVSQTDFDTGTPHVVSEIDLDKNPANPATSY